MSQLELIPKEKSTFIKYNDLTLHEKISAKGKAVIDRFSGSFLVPLVKRMQRWYCMSEFL